LGITRFENGKCVEVKFDIAMAHVCHDTLISDVGIQLYPSTG